MYIKAIAGLFLLICSITDIRKRVVYAKVLAVFMAAGCAAVLLLHDMTIGDALGGMMVGAAMLSLTALTKGEIGAGDGLALIVTGCFLGLTGNIRLLCGGLFFASLWCLPHIALRRYRKKSEIPFMPFLFASFMFL